MATGKTVAKYIEIRMDDSGGAPRVITASCNSVNQVGLESETPDVTAYSDGWVNALVGLPKGDIELGGPFSNVAAASPPAQTGAHTVFSVLQGLNTGFTFDIRFGIQAAPTTGDPKWTGEYVCASYNVEPGGPNDALKWKAKLTPFGATAGAWGTV